MAEDHSPTQKQENKPVVSHRLHLTINKAYPALLEEVLEIKDGLRSTRILGLANLGLLVERGYFTGEFLRAVQDPAFQKVLLAFKEAGAPGGSSNLNLANSNTNEFQVPSGDSAAKSTNANGATHNTGDDQSNSQPPVFDSSDGEMQSTGVKVTQERSLSTRRIV